MGSFCCLWRSDLRKSEIVAVDLRVKGWTMAQELDWIDTEDLAILLSEKFPTQNPLEIRFTDLHRMVIELPGFAGDPKTSNEAKLEAIQMAWYEEWQEAQ
jgi:FeS assembly protein IscX